MRKSELRQIIKEEYAKLCEEEEPELYELLRKDEPQKQIPELVKFSNDPIYKKFIKDMDNGERTGWGLKIFMGDLLIHGMIGNMSSGRRQKEFKIKKPIGNIKELKEFMKQSGAIDYIIALGKEIFGKMQAYKNYLAGGGVND